MLKIGHRGAGGEAPENTIKSFESAIKAGVNAIELDVRQTKDKKLVVMHDEKLDKLAGVKGRVGDFTLEQLKHMSIGGEKIPTLGEALDFIDRKVEKLLVEIKEPGTEKAILDEIEKRKLKDKIIIVSFHEDALEKVRKLDKEVETGFIYASYGDPIGTAKRIGANYLLPLYRFTHTKDVERAHQNGFKVIVWTVNTKEEIEEYKKKGVDGIASDYPELLAGA